MTCRKSWCDVHDPRSRRGFADGYVSWRPFIKGFGSVDYGVTTRFVQNKKSISPGPKSPFEVGYGDGAITTLATVAGNAFIDGQALDKPHNQAFFFSYTTTFR